jgi:Fe-S cluster assembly iron-binding protein IscA
MGRTSYNSSAAGFVVDPKSVDRLDGRQIDWTRSAKSVARRPVPPS